MKKYLSIIGWFLFFLALVLLVDMYGRGAWWLGILAGFGVGIMTYFYVAIDILLVVYACYSWYWQAKVDFRGRYRISSVVWALIFIWLGFT